MLQGRREEGVVTVDEEGDFLMDENLCVRCEKILHLHEAAVLVVASFPKSLVICEDCAALDPV